MTVVYNNELKIRKQIKKSYEINARAALVWNALINPDLSPHGRKTQLTIIQNDTFENDEAGIMPGIIGNKPLMV